MLKKKIEIINTARLHFGFLELSNNYGSKFGGIGLSIDKFQTKIVVKKSTKLTEEGLINWCRENMANYKVPREVVFLEELPLNAAGKVMKFKLRELVK